MAVYAITGRLGSGKSLCASGRIRDKLFAGCRVATNLNLNLHELVNKDAKQTRVIRLPDKPTVWHLEAIGQGNDTMNEDNNGAIVLDEMAAYMNARTFQDKERQPVIDWLIHSRKKGWDVIFIMQHLNQIDKQVREALVEYHVTCRRLDRMKIPLVGGLVNTVTFGKVKGTLPRIHVATVKYGTEHNAMVADRWVFMGNDLFQAYDTRQVFINDPDQAPFSYLPPWYTHGRLMPQKVRGIKAKRAEQRRITELQRAGVITFAQWQHWMRTM